MNDGRRDSNHFVRSVMLLKGEDMRGSKIE